MALILNEEQQLLKDTDIKNLVITNTPTTKWDTSYYNKFNKI